MKVAVAGGGIFGVTAAIHAARAGHGVHLYEASDMLLSAASGINQYRLHAGYHYPRSPETAAACRQSLVSFTEEYGKAVVSGERHLYAVAREGRRTSPEQYLAFCDRLGLPYKVVMWDGRPVADGWPGMRAVDPVFSDETVELAIEAEEARYDPGTLRNLASSKLRESGHHNVYLGTKLPKDAMDRYDKVIVATYAATNLTLARLGRWVKRRKYQFEVCEKPVVRMPSQFRGLGAVVMDGPFGSIDPFGGSDLHVLGHVVHAVHHTNIGFEPEIPYALSRDINAFTASPAATRHRDFIRDGARFVPQLREAEWSGSMFVVRAVLPGVDATDERPTLVETVDAEDRIIRIFSGKVSTCVEAAKQAVALLGDEQRQAA